MSYLPRKSLMTSDPKATRFPQALVKQNATPDRYEMSRRSNVIDINPDVKVKFPMTTLAGDAGDAKILFGEMNPAYRMRVDLLGSQHGQPRNMLNQNITVKVLDNINGLEGSQEEMKKKIEPCGWIEQANADTRTAQVNILRGGSFTILYNGINPVRQNGLLELDVPTVTEADKMMADREAQARGSKGVVTLMYKEHNPHEKRYLCPSMLGYHLSDKAPQSRFKTSAEKLVATLAGIYDLIDASKDEKSSTAAAIKKLIVDSDPLSSTGISIVSLLNGFQQYVGETHVEDARWVVARAQHPGVNGNYIPIQALHYAS
jgi:hypothetical protein